MEGLVLRTGLYSAEDPRTTDMMEQIICLVTMLLNAAVKDASVYAQAANRKCVSPRDIHLALMRLVVPNSAFWTQEAFQADADAMHHMLFGEESGSDSDQDSDSAAGPAVLESEEEEDWVAAESSCAVTTEMNEAEAAFTAWLPDGPLLQALKRATENIICTAS
jgi:hypothetical protein